MKKLTAFFRTLAVIGLLLTSSVDSLLAQTVYTTRTGEKYHASGCQYLRKSSYATQLADAIAAGYTACSRCDPHTAVSSGETKSTIKSATLSRCQATTKKGSQCKHAAAAGSSYCWQHQ